MSLLSTIKDFLLELLGRKPEFGALDNGREYFKDFFGWENEYEFIEPMGKNGYSCKFYDTDKYLIQVIFKNNRAVAKHYLDKNQNINYYELTNLTRHNLKSFEVKNLIYQSESKSAIEINSQGTKAIILYYKELKYMNGDVIGIYPLKSILYLIDKGIIELFLRKSREAKKLKPRW